MARIENEKQYEAAMQRIEELVKVVDNDTPRRQQRLHRT